MDDWIFPLSSYLTVDDVARPCKRDIHQNSPITGKIIVSPAIIEG